MSQQCQVSHLLFANNRRLFVVLFAQPRVLFLAVETRSSSEEKEGSNTQKPINIEEKDNEELQGIECGPPPTKTPPRKSTKNMPNESDEPSMSAGAAQAAANSDNLFSTADADIGLERWTAEDCCLSQACEKKADLGNVKMRWNACVLVVLTHSKADKDAVECVPVIPQGHDKTKSLEKPIASVRITKKRVASVLRNATGAVALAAVCGDNKKAAASMGESVCNDDNDPVCIVDAHFPNPIRRVVPKIKDVHLELTASGCQTCKACLHNSPCKKTCEIANAVAFEIEEVAVRQTHNTDAVKTASQVDISE